MEEVFPLRDLRIGDGRTWERKGPGSSRVE
jgi:hypothetical protein